MKAIDLMVANLLPPDLRDPARRYDKKGIDKLLAEVARRYPERYAEIAEGLADLGRNTAYFQGETLTLADMKAPFDKSVPLAQMDTELDAVRDSDLPDDQKRLAKLKIWERYAGQLEKQTVDTSLRAGNNLANTVVSGARGNPFQLKAMVTTPALYTDYRDRPVELFVRNSFGEGLRPGEYLASTFGVRKSVISTKNLTAEGGDMLKQLMQVSTPLIVTSKDCDTTNGLDFAADDDSLRGRLLGHAAAGIPAGTPIDREVMNKLRQAKVKTVIARSPMTCQAKEGICAKCLGMLPEGKLAPLGYAAGITAAQSVGEPVTQGALNCLAEGTWVRMADLSDRPIEQVRVGEQVLGANQHGHTFPVLVTGKWDQGLQPCVHLVVGKKSEHVGVVATEIHEFLTADHGKQPLRHIAEKKLSLRMAAGEHATVPYTLHEALMGRVPCWDLTVDHPDHLFVLANGLICSNTKHGGGGFTGGKKQFAGLPVITQFIQSPEVFPHRAATAHLDGRVEAIDPAPQGGTFITVGGQQHFALPGYEPTVKVGDEVEAGDSLSEGIVDPADVVNFRGLGEARRYYAERLGQILSDSGAGNPSKLNLETLARATLDHVRVDDPDGLGDYLVDDLASYNRVAPDYSPPVDTKPLSLEKAKGMYLQSPALHYTIGTRLTPRMLKHLGTVGFQQVNASPTKPTFTPEMVRLRGANFNNPDWLAKLDTSYLSTNLAGDAARARDTNVGENVHFAPRLAVGVGFGQKVEQTGKF